MQGDTHRKCFFSCRTTKDTPPPSSLKVLFLLSGILPPSEGSTTKKKIYVCLPLDMGCINQTTKCCTLEDWKSVIRTARSVKPYHVPDVDQSWFKDFKSLLGPFYPRVCTFKTQPIKEIYFRESETSLRNYINIKFTIICKCKMIGNYETGCLSMSI